ncbi:hypothetical protein ILYODFUR_024195 [Ilyodon furcidens]|uniref:Uncharacterized protein n=1 Tax=Ilyodon furcidens TaxID=33524 RepID=A0ABV0UYM4_9TELE
MLFSISLRLFYIRMYLNVLPQGGANSSHIETQDVSVFLRQCDKSEICSKKNCSHTFCQFGTSKRPGRISAWKQPGGGNPAGCKMFGDKQQEHDWLCLDGLPKGYYLPMEERQTVKHLHEYSCITY